MTERQVVIFGLNEEEYGVEISEVQEIVRYQDITKLPEALDFIKGIINLRGKVIPVIDLKVKFYQQHSEISGDTRIIVIKIKDNDIGIIADHVSEVKGVPERDIENTTMLMESIAGLKGIAKLEGRLVMLLDMEKALSAEEMKQINKQTIL